MAEDWIKMRKQLERHPKVRALASALSTDRFRIIGGLFAAWSLFDTYTEDGQLPAYNADGLGEVIGWPGFGEAMLAVDWLQVLPTGLVMPRFDTHNGESAKKRAMDAERKRVARMSADTADKSGTEKGLDKIREREELKAKAKKHVRQAARFTEFWNAYPQKTGKKPCMEKWKARGLDQQADTIIADVEARKVRDKKWIEGFIPNPLTYINQDRWADGLGVAAVLGKIGAGVAGNSPAKVETAATHLQAAEDWAVNMRNMGVPEAEITEHLERVRAKWAA